MTQTRERVEYVLTDDELALLLEASKPVPYMLIGGVEPSSPQENTNNAWRRLAQERGFDWTTVQAVPGKDRKHFTALPEAVSR